MAISPQQLSSKGKGFLSKIEFDADEELIMEVRKDKFGLFLIYFTGGLITAVLTVALLFAASYDQNSINQFLGADVSGAISALVVLLFFLIIGSVIMTAIGAFLYANNVVLITSEKVSQLLYITIFKRKVSQLGIADVQDVTVRQDGIFAHIFDYGTLTVETAGEQANYIFSFTPKPYEVAKALIGSHEADVHKHGN